MYRGAGRYSFIRITSIVPIKYVEGIRNMQPLIKEEAASVCSQLLSLSGEKKVGLRMVNGMIIIHP